MLLQFPFGSLFIELEPERYEKEQNRSSSLAYDLSQRYLFKYNRGRTGFDSSLEARAACRGWFVGLVKNRTKKINADHEDLALAA